MWDKILDINKCHLQEDPDAIRNEVRDFANANGLTFNPQRTLWFIENLDVTYSFDWRDHVIDSVF
jgi:hypothetical protein